MNSKLGFSSAYNRPRNLSPISPTPTPTTKTKTKTHPDSGGHSRSATITKLNSVIKHLSDENKTLKDEILELRDTVKQIFNESRHEKYDERRINLIKFQVIQLERQISILTEALGSRSEALLEVENSLTLVADKLRSFISADVKGQMVPIARSDLMSLVEISESSRIKLFKSIEKNTPEELGKDLLYLNPCLNNSRKQEDPVTVLDINLKRMDFINLRYVSQLESKLSLLYKNLVGIHNQIETVQNKNGDCRLLNGNAATTENERLKSSLLKTGVSLKDCTDDLLALSLLCPSAPWPILKRPVAKDIPVDRIMTALPPMTPNKQEEVSHLIKACISTLNHRIHLMHKEKSVFEEELAFHRAVYDTQMKYTNVVFDAVREGCKTFEESARSLLCAPLKCILEAYSLLETTKSKGALKEILLILKANESQMKSIVEMFEDPGTENNLIRSEALSSFSTDFMQHVDSLISSCQKKRDKALQEKREVKDRLKALDIELRQCIEELEAKYDKQWVPKHDKFVLDSRLSHHNPFDSELFPSNCSNSKEFIHSQLFGDVDNKDDSTGEITSSRQDKKIRSKKNDIDDCNDNMDVLKLRSFLDNNDEGDLEGEINSSSRKAIHKTKWVSNFGSSNMDDITTDKSVDNENSSVVENSKSSTTARSKKPWKPEKEWVNDFSADSNLLDQMEDMTLSSKDASCVISNGRLSNQNMQRENNEDEQAVSSKSRNKSKGSRRSYEVDLRVANTRLRLKRPDSMSDISNTKNRKS